MYVSGHHLHDSQCGDHLKVQKHLEPLELDELNWLLLKKTKTTQFNEEWFNTLFPNFCNNLILRSECVQGLQ